MGAGEHCYVSAFLCTVQQLISVSTSMTLYRVQSFFDIEACADRCVPQFNGAMRAGGHGKVVAGIGCDEPAPEAHTSVVAAETTTVAKQGQLTGCRDGAGCT